MGFAEMLTEKRGYKHKHLRQYRSNAHGVRLLRERLMTVGKVICLLAAMATSWTMLDIFYPQGTDLQLLYILSALVFAFAAIICHFSKNIFLLLAYFCGILIFCYLLKLALPSAGRLPEWIWFFLSLIYAIFLWIAYEIGKYTHPERT